MSYTEDELLPISAVQHYLFCNRRAALIHSEGLWSENRYTIEGTQLHERADDPRLSQNLSAVKIARAVGLCSYRFGLTGKADVIEFHRTDEEARFNVHIIEYKRGKPKPRLDLPFQVQLCAQALCVEDMLGYPVTNASIYYGQIRHRHPVELDSSLRDKTTTTIQELHTLIQSSKTPPPEYKPRKCKECSLVNLCMPAAPRPVATASRYLRTLINDEDDAT